MIINYKLGNNKLGVSAVIGVILMVAITVAIAATVYVYFGGMLDEGSQITPGIIMMAESSNDKDRVIVTIISITDSGINWNDVSGILNNDTGSYRIELKNYWRPTDEINPGDTIEIINGQDIPFINSSQFLESQSKYSLSLRYDVTNALMGTVKWVH